MMMRRSLPLIAAGALTALAGCGSHTAADSTAYRPADEGPVAVAVGRKAARTPAAAMPRATVYRTNGDFNRNVPVTLTADGKSIASYPAPTDLSDASLPIPLTDGWLLDRRGVGPRTAFTTFTYEQYMALPAPPSPEELMKALIPGARVTEAVALPMTPSAAAADRARVDRIIESGFPDCDTIVMMHAVMLSPVKTH